MWTPRPVRPFRYAGSVATSVLPSPVAISAIVPSWSTMPPISWTSKWRIPTVRRAASRHTAKASGRTSSSVPSRSIRFLNSFDFALVLGPEDLFQQDVYHDVLIIQGAFADLAAPTARERDRARCR